MTYRHEARRPVTCWVIVGDRSRVRFFAGEWPELADLDELPGLAHPEANLHQRDVEADKQGRFYEAKGPKHVGEPPTDFKHRTAREFARQVVARLEAGHSENAYGRVVIIAPALFLGVLRKELPASVAQRVVADLDKDLTQADLQTIRTAVTDLCAAVT